MRNDPSVAADGARWRWAFVTVFIIEQASKLALACALAPFPDEAFYWQESRHPAWGYSDLPGMTAWLIRIGESVAGHGVFGMRWPFLLLGATLPWLMVAFTRREFGARRGWQAGLLLLGLPLAGSLGVLAVPDVLLSVASLLALMALLRAMRTDRWWDWLLLGGAVALGLMTHYRAAMLLLAGLVYALATPRGRGLWRRRGWYVALGLGALGALPTLYHNFNHRWLGLQFQLLDRHPWQFHADALWQPLEQALVCTPLFYMLLLWAAARSVSRVHRGQPWDLVACASLTVLVGYFVLGLFADGERFRLHWPLLGYLPLLAVVPTLAAEWWRAQRAALFKRGFLVATWAMLAVGQAATLAYLGVASGFVGDPAQVGSKWYPQQFVGWTAAGDAAKRLLQQPELAGAVLVADNFRLAAELDFALAGSRPVYVLDSPLNHKHGRAPQLHAWRLDEAALHSDHANARVLLMVEETALRERQRPAWLGSVCAHFNDLQSLARLDSSPDKRIAFYAAEVRAVPRPGPYQRDHCLIWQQAYAAYMQALPGHQGCSDGYHE